MKASGLGFRVLRVFQEFGEFSGGVGTITPYPKP